MAAGIILFYFHWLPSCWRKNDSLCCTAAELGWLREGGISEASKFFVATSFVRENAKKQDFARSSLNNTSKRSASCLTERKYESCYLNNWYSSLECVGDKNI